MTSIYFSPKGTTQATARAITSAWEGVTERDLLTEPLREPVAIPAGEPVLVAMPVYAGRIPGLCREMLERYLQGSGGPAVAVAVYGNRDYDDALAELQDLLEAKGFRVVAAGAFVAEHSIFTQVAAGRRDERDRAAMAGFGTECRERIAAFRPEGVHTPIVVKGSHDLRPAKGVPFHPACGPACTQCGPCARLCPAGAIPADDPTVTDVEKCISCGACIRVCPVQARSYQGEAYAKTAAGFAGKCAARREPELFF